MRVGSSLPLSLSLLVIGCAGSVPVPDAGGLADSGAVGGEDAGEDAGTDAGATDAGGVDAGALDGGGLDGGSDAGASQLEAEPNNAGTATEVNEIVVPGEVLGAIGSADDLDVLTVQLSAGQLWQWELGPAGAGSAFVPHLAVGEHANVVPALVAKATTQTAASQEQFVLRSGRYNLIVRDGRNLGTSQHVGGPGHTWRLRAAALTRTPTSLTLPATTSGALPHRQAVALYGFTLASSSDVDVQVLCANKSQPSDMDPRLTLYDTTHQAYLQTNDDRALADVDSWLHGTLPAASYVLVIDNVSESANDLSYELRVVTN